MDSAPSYISGWMSPRLWLVVAVGVTSAATACSGDHASSPAGGVAGSGGTAGTGGAAGGSPGFDASSGDDAGGTAGAGGTGGASGAGGAGGSGAGGISGATIVNDRFWKDSAGNDIYSQGGGMLRVGDTYYWYGVKYGGAPTYAANPTNNNSDTSFKGVTTYSSKDLVIWKLEATDVPANTSGWFGRLGVAYNASSKKYVLVAQGGGGLLPARPAPVAAVRAARAAQIGPDRASGSI